jgi:Ca2+-binding EF-hand superfamily protein
MRQAATEQKNQALLQETLPLIFDAIDVNKDGSISKSTLLRNYYYLNLNK